MLSHQTVAGYDIMFYALFSGTISCVYVLLLPAARGSYSLGAEDLIREDRMVRR